MPTPIFIFIDICSLCWFQL